MIPHVHKAIILAVLLAAASSLNVAYAASRGISVAVRASESMEAPVTETVELYGDSYALIIGNDDYTNGWPKLSNAIKDAELIAETLKAKGFQITFHKNLKSSELEEVFKQFFIVQGDDPSARLFVWYAGHGATLGGEGYLVPADAPVLQEEAEFKFSALNMRRFGTFMHQARAKHVYAVFDSCFAGTVFNSQRALPPSAITRATTLPVRQFLTSGDDTQTVSDDGTFRQLFIRALTAEENADSNGDGYLTASELGLYLGDRVTNLTQSLQTPRFGKLRDKDFDRGDFVFMLPETDPSPVIPAESAPNLDTAGQIAFWESIKDSNNPAAFDAYLQQFPDGIFALLAKLKKQELEAGITTAPPKKTPEPEDKGPSLVERFQAFTRSDPEPEGDGEAAAVPEVAVASVPEPAGDPEPEPEAVQEKQQEPVATPEPKQPPKKVRLDTKTIIAQAEMSSAIRQRMEKILGLAESGNVSAQFSLGYMFEKGEVRDLFEAAKWYRRAAEQGNGRAQLSLAALYESGSKDVPQDWTQAIVWYRQAADGGDPDAQQKLGYLYEHGLGLPRDVFAAAEFYQMAAEQGRVTAQNNLGRLYQLGTGVGKDEQRAIYWYEQAAAQGSDVARANLDKLQSDTE